RGVHQARRRRPRHGRRPLAGIPRGQWPRARKEELMPVNQTLSTYSDMAYATSVVVYILAMLLYFAEFSGGRTGTVARKRESALVGAGGGDSTSTPAVGHVPTPEKRPLGERL